ncbi:uncharacterized protein LOC144083484 isoform X4 [Stigmatopora argus]
MRPDDDTAGGQILTDLREEPADRPREQLGQMHVATAFVVPGALDNVEEEQEEKNGVQPTHPPTSQGLLASPRDSRGFEPCPRHWADVDVDEGDWQNNATMRFLDSRRFWCPRVRLRGSNQLLLRGQVSHLVIWTSSITYICWSPRFGKPFRLKTVHPTSHPFLPLSHLKKSK